MSWLQTRPNVSDPTLYYTVGLNKTLLLVGLGNPGKEYVQTRHNVGFMCLDAFVAANSEMEPWIQKKDLKCFTSTGQLGGNRVIAMKPTTFMNASGEAVQAVCSFYKINPEQIVVVHDELDIDFGTIRLRTGGSSAGHNGIKSITETIGEQYGRVRAGIGPKKPIEMDSSDFVLQKFSAEQLKQLPKLNREVTAILTEFIFSGSLLTETRSFL